MVIKKFDVFKVPFHQLATNHREILTVLAPVGTRYVDVVTSLKNGFPAGPYRINRAQLAQMVAAHTSGLADAIPEQADFDYADEMLVWLEAKLRK